MRGKNCNTHRDTLSDLTFVAVGILVALDAAAGLDPEVDGHDEGTAESAATLPIHVAPAGRLADAPDALVGDGGVDGGTLPFLLLLAEDARHGDGGQEGHGDKELHDDDDRLLHGGLAPL